MNLPRSIALLTCLTFISCYHDVFAVEHAQENSVLWNTMGHKRNKRSGTCFHPKYNHISGHTACVGTSSTFIRGGVTDEDRKIIVDEHNKYRSGVSPTATNMLKMSWDEEVAKIAQRWAENCRFDHDDSYKRSIPGRYTVGQNLGSGYSSFSATIKAWYDEVSDFSFGGTNDLHAVGHYTQVVWAKSYKIGCGYAECTNLPRFYVCNYAPAGNVGGINRPYTTGNSCGACASSCSDKLCDCTSTQCYNEGTLNEDSCTCQCKPRYYGNRCYLNCTGNPDSSHCGSSFTPDTCEKYSNVPSDCPKMCGSCPYGAQYGEDDGSSAISTRTYGIALSIPFMLVILFAF